MFDQSVRGVLVAAVVLAIALSIGLAVLIARMLARPLEEVGEAARRIADGDYAARVPREGPEEIASLADSFNQMAAALQEQERHATGVHRQRRPRAAHAADEPAGLPRGAPRRCHRGRRDDLRLALGGSRSPRPAGALARCAGGGRSRRRARAPDRARSGAHPRGLGRPCAPGAGGSEHQGRACAGRCPCPLVATPTIWPRCWRTCSRTPSATRPMAAP